MASVAVCGYMVRHPVPGNIYAFLHYVVGLRRLGHRVIYVEESGWPGSCYDPLRNAYGDDPTVGMGIVTAELARNGAADVPVAFVNRQSGRVWGWSGEELHAALRSCDLLLNVGGVCWLPELGWARRRALVDMDPLFTQAGTFARDGLDQYDLLLTYGANVGSGPCAVPTLGRTWVPTVPPVVVSMWRLGRPPPGAPFSTVANWSSYGAVEVDGVRYEQKDVEFLRLADLPRRAGHQALLAVSGADAESADRMSSGGWSVVPAPESAGDIPSYRELISRSAAEVSAAKHGYVASRSGWFSDRSVCYLASGRPVVVQDTGLGAAVPVGDGVLAFSTLEEAAAAMEDVVTRWPHHSRHARRLARRVFGHDVVLPRLLDHLGVGHAAA